MKVRCLRPWFGAFACGTWTLGCLILALPGTNSAGAIAFALGLNVVVLGPLVCQQWEQYSSEVTRWKKK